MNENRIIEMIRRKYGDMCRMCPPPDKERCCQAEKSLPAELYEILKLSNGIEEMMIHPNVDDGKPFVIGWMIYPIDEIQNETKAFYELYGESGTVFAGNGAGGYYVLGTDGRIYLYEYIGEDGECIADSLEEHFSKL